MLSRMNKRSALWTIAVNIMVSATACSPEYVGCTGVPTPGVLLAIVDAADGRDLSRTARVTIRLLSDDFREVTGTPKEAAQLTVLAGRYSMIVRAAGYRDAVDTLVVTSSKQGACDEAIVQKQKEVRLLRAS